MNLLPSGAVSRCRLRVIAALASVVPLVVGPSSASTRAIAPRASATATARSSFAGQNIPLGTSLHAIRVGGRVRTFLVYRPRTLGLRRLPMIVVFHGGTGSARQAERSYGWNAAARTHRTIVVYGQGTYAGWSVGGGCCGLPAKHHVNDVAYTRAVVATMEHSLAINPNRIYATGMSEGALLSYHLACATSLFAAIAPVSGTVLGACRKPAPTSVLDIHGTADPRVRYNGTTGAGINQINGPSVPDLNRKWRERDRCGAVLTTRIGPVTRALARCPSGRSVEEITIDGGSHYWPGSDTPPHDLVDKLDTFNATTTIAKFFATHRRGLG